MPYLGRGIAGIVAALDNGRARPRCQQANTHRRPKAMERGLRRCAFARAQSCRSFQAAGRSLRNRRQQTRSPISRAPTLRPQKHSRCFRMTKPAASNEQNPLWQGEAGETATRFFGELLTSGNAERRSARRRLRRPLRHAARPRKRPRAHARASAHFNLGTV